MRIRYLMAAVAVAFITSSVFAKPPPPGQLGGGGPSVEFLRTIVVNPVGPTEADNALEFFAALEEAVLLDPVPSAANPVLVIVEPGTFDVTAGTLAQRTIPPFVHVAGSGPGATHIKADVCLIVCTPPSFVLIMDSNTELRDLTVQIVSLDLPAIQVGTGGIVIGNDQNVFIRNVRIIGPGGSHEGVKGFTGASVRLQHVEIEDVLFAVRQVGTGKIEFDNLRTDRSISADVGTVIGRGSIVGSLDAKNAGTISLATTQVLGSTAGVTTGTATCVFSYDDSFAPLDAMCE